VAETVVEAICEADGLRCKERRFKDARLAGTRAVSHVEIGHRDRRHGPFKERRCYERRQSAYGRLRPFPTRSGGAHQPVSSSLIWVFRPSRPSSALP